MAFRFKLTEYPGQDNSHTDGEDSEFYSPNAWSELFADQPPGPQTVDQSVWGFYS